RLVYQWSNVVPVVPVNRLARRLWLRRNGLSGNCPEWRNVLARQAPMVIISRAVEGWCVHGLLLEINIKRHRASGSNDSFVLIGRSTAMRAWPVRGFVPQAEAVVQPGKTFKHVLCGLRKGLAACLARGARGVIDIPKRT